MFKQYRKRPVVIEAFEVVDGVLPDIPEVVPVYGVDGTVGVVSTLEGDMNVSEGDYIIRGVANEIYLCNPEIFKMTYEAVN